MAAPRSRMIGMLYLGVAGSLMLTVICCVIYAHKDQLLVYYYVSSVAEQDQAPAARDWLVAHRQLALPVLLEQSRWTSGPTAERLGRQVRTILQHYPDPTNPEHSHLSLWVSSELARTYAERSASGREQAVLIALTIIEFHLTQWSPNLATILDSAGELVLLGVKDTELSVVKTTLKQVAQLWQWRIVENVAPQLLENWMHQLYKDAALWLAPSSPEELRQLAAVALRRAPFNDDDATLIQVFFLDRSAAVRREALLTLAEIAGDPLTDKQKEMLLPLLNHEQPLYRNAVRKIFQAAGLSPARLELARLVTASTIEERATVPARALQFAQEESEIRLSDWLLALRDDPAIPVRSALLDSLEQIRQDPKLYGHLDQQVNDLLTRMALHDPEAELRQRSSDLLCVLPLHTTAPAALANTVDPAEGQTATPTIAPTPVIPAAAALVVPPPVPIPNNSP